MADTESGEDYGMAYSVYDYERLMDRYGDNWWMMAPSDMHVNNRMINSFRQNLEVLKAEMSVMGFEYDPNSNRFYRKVKVHHGSYHPRDLAWHGYTTTETEWRSPDFSGAANMTMSSKDNVAGNFEQGGGSLDFQSASDVEKIIHISKGIRDANQSGQYFVDMRQLFSNFPKYGDGVDIIGNIKIGKQSMTVHMNLAIYNNMRIDIYPALTGQRGPFNNVNVNGITKSGYWELMGFNRYEGNIPMLWIQINNNFDTYYDYLYNK